MPHPFFRYATHSLLFYWRNNLAVILAVAVATALLTGALMVGSSMRTSLRELALGRLGKIDSLIVSRGFFNADLAGRVGSKDAAPAIFFRNATAESRLQETDRRATGLSLWGVNEEFGNFFSTATSDWKMPTDDQVVLSRPLAEELQIDDAAVTLGKATVTLRVQRPSSLPSESAMGEKEELTASIVGLQVIAIVDDSGLGGITLTPTQAGTKNAFVSLTRLQMELDEPAISVNTGPNFANMILLKGTPDQSAMTPEELTEFRKTLPVRAIDLGLDVHPVEIFSEQENGDRETVYSATALSTASLVFSDEEVKIIADSYPDARQLSTYLINSLRKPEGAVIIPYSMFTALGEPVPPLQLVDGSILESIGLNEVILNEWGANDLQAAVGDSVVVRYFQPESTHGQTVELERTLKVAGVARLTEPATVFLNDGRGNITPARFEKTPTLANDPDLTPIVPGMTDSQSIDDWDVPFELTETVRKVDDEYWNYYRTTPRGFVSMETARSMWPSRFGVITGFRFPAGVSVEDVSAKIVSLWQSSALDGGLSVMPIRFRMIAASSGSTPFDALFLGLSMFIIVAALILVAVLFRLGLEDRVRQLGLLSATGFSASRISRLWSIESIMVITLGAIGGAFGGIGWAALMIRGLSSWWVGAIGRPFLKLHLDPPSILIGAGLGILTAMITVWWNVRSMSRMPSADLLAGRFEKNDVPGARSSPRRWIVPIATLCMALAIVAAVVGLWLGGESQAGVFMGGGFLMLVGLLLLLHHRLARRDTDSLVRHGTLAGLASSSLRRNPLRSVLTVALVSVATFLVVAINAFTLRPESQSSGGITHVATSTEAIFADLNSQSGRDTISSTIVWNAGAGVYSFRVMPGDDASCNNVFQSTRPQVLGVPQVWINRFDDNLYPAMRWSGSAAATDLQRKNPWHLLDGGSGAIIDPATGDPVVDTVIDKNTAWYSLKVYSIGSLFPVEFESGRRVVFRVAGFLENSLLQGSLLIGEKDFERVFPEVGGYRFFLIDDGAASGGEVTVADSLEEALAERGFDSVPSSVLLSGFMSVQNTYLSAFQSLGGLGLLLGTFGLAAVMMRNIVRRQAELGLMQCIGFPPSRLSRMILTEQFWLLAWGLGLGLIAAAVSTFPHLVAGGAGLPWVGLTAILGGTSIAGLATGWFVSRRISRLPLLDSLRK